MKIGVVGLGLIGGSIYKALWEDDVIGISSSQLGKAPNITDDFSYLKDCEIVFVCSPINKMVETLDKIENFVSPETIVTDVASVKQFVCDKKRPYIFIPGHPMAGTEKSGFDNSYPELFKGAKWVLTPDKIDVDTVKLEGIIQKMGASVVYANPKEHDEAVALISHAPAIISQAIFMAAIDNPLALKLASSGFRDMTRLAMSSEDMLCSMVQNNPECIRKSVQKFNRVVENFLKHPSKNKFACIKKSRQSMYVDGKNVL